MSPQLVESDPDAGFEYPYYLHVPDDYDGGPILVEPTNTGRQSDTFADHREVAEQRAAGGTSRRVADRLGVPYLHPVFPRPASEPVDWTHYVHGLCARTMRLTDGPLARVDLQTVAMIDDARDRIAGDVPRDVLVDGFSASAAFANRFTVLHPDRVRAVSAGGVNGMVTLPIETVETPDQVGFEDTIATSYPVGVADVPELTGNAFDAAAFRATPQFYYLGEADEKDSLLYPDTWTDYELRAAAIVAYGPAVHDTRFPNCAATYDAHDVSAVFRTYPDTGHEPTPAIDDVVTFHDHVIAGDDPTADGVIGGNPVPVDEH